MTDAVAARTPAPRIPTGFLLPLTGFAVSSLGTGMVIPFTAVYISGRLSLGLDTAGQFFAVTALVALGTGAVAGALSDRVGSGRVAAAGLLSTGMGYLVLGQASGRAVVLAAAVVIGIGTGSIGPAMVPTISCLVEPEQRRKAFALRYLAMNAGIGLGALASTLVLHLVHGLVGYRLVYALDALTFVPLAVIFARVRPAGAAAPAVTEPGQLSYRRLLGIPVLRRLVVYQVLIVLFAYGQFQSGLPLLLTHGLEVPTDLLGFVVTVNTVAVVVSQLPMNRVLSRAPESTGLFFAAVLWMVTFVTGLIAQSAHGAVRTVLVLAIGSLFALGETAYAASSDPFVVRVAPPGALGRVGALSSTASSVGSVAAPVLSVTIVAHTSLQASWLIFVMCLGGAAAVAVTLRRSAALSAVTAAADAAPAVAARKSP